MKLIKDNKKTLVAFIIGILVTGNIVLAADKILNASEITYKNNTVEYALNDLNGKTNNLVSGEYSTDKEVVVGTWIDGSPVYRKVFTGLNISSQSSWHDIPGVSIQNVKQIIGGKSMRTSDGAVSIDLYRVNGNNVQIYATYGSLDTIDLVVIEYTKTTDEATN